MSARTYCRENATIANAREADDLRKRCNVLEGDLTLEYGISESINLDSLEEVEGSILHEGCSLFGTQVAYENGWCEVPPAFEIRSTTLKQVGGSIWFSRFPGLDKVTFPNLDTVNGSISLNGVNNLTYLDLTNLKRIRSFTLHAERLETFKLDGLESFTEGKGMISSRVHLGDIGMVESVDGLFENPLDPMSQGRWTGEDGQSFYGRRMSHVRSLTFGWRRINALKLTGENLTVTLGGPSTESMEIENLEVRDGVAELRRNPQLRNLTIGAFELGFNNSITDLELPFDQLSSIAIYGTESLRSITLPPEAENWNWNGQNQGLTITNTPNLELSPDTWHWPKSDISRVLIIANISNEFLWVLYHVLNSMTKETGLTIHIANHS